MPASHRFVAPMTEAGKSLEVEKSEALVLPADEPVVELGRGESKLLQVPEAFATPVNPKTLDVVRLQTAELPSWPDGVSRWWFTVQARAIEDLTAAAERQVVPTQNIVEPCLKLNAELAPWRETTQQRLHKLELQRNVYEQKLEQTDRAIKAMPANEFTKTISNAAKSSLQSVLQGIKEMNTLSDKLFDTLVANDQKEFQALVTLLRWNIVAYHNSIAQVNSAKQSLHGALPEDADPIKESKVQGSCSLSLDQLQTQYKQFVQRVADETQNLCVMEKAKAIQLALEQPSPNSLDVLLQCAQEMTACLQDVPGLAAENSTWQDKIQALQTQCGNSVSAVALKLTTIQEAHRIVDSVSDKVLANRKDEMVNDIYSMAVQTARAMHKLHSQFLTDESAVESGFQQRLQNVMSSLNNMQNLISNANPLLYTAMVTATASVEILIHTYYQKQTLEQMQKLIAAADTYCSAIQNFQV